MWGWALAGTGMPAGYVERSGARHADSCRGQQDRDLKPTLQLVLARPQVWCWLAVAGELRLPQRRAATGSPARHAVRIRTQLCSLCTHLHCSVLWVRAD